MSTQNTLHQPALAIGYCYHSTNGRMQENQELPQGWVEISLETIATINPRNSHALEDTELVSFIPMQCVEEESGKVDTSHKRPLLEVKKGYTQFINGDIISAKITPCMENGKVAIVNNLSNGVGYGSTEFHVIRLANGLERKYIFHHLVSQTFRNGAQHNMTGSAGQKRVPADFIKKAIILLPPLPEQRRIVTKLEELFSRLDAGVATLRQTQAQLKRYRQSVLHAAVTGELTRAWRAAQPPSPESGAALLQRIRQERRAQWEAAQTAKRGGQLPLNDTWKSKYEEPAAPDTSELPELPSGWVWASMGECFDVFVGATPSRAQPAYWNGDIPWVSSGEVAFCRIKSTREAITELGLANTSTNIHPKGTVLIGMIGEGKTRGQVAILDIEACNNQNSAAIRVSASGLPSQYVYHYLSSVYDETRRNSAGNNQPALNKSRVQAMVIRLPPLVEQKQIVLEVERLLSVLDNLERTLAAELTRAERLRQSILHRAFTGQLVPQDPTDEPAAALLARLRAAPAAAPAAKARRGRQPQATQTALEL